MNGKVSDTRPHTTTEAIYALLETVKDPEIPVLSILDLGIVRRVEWKEEQPDQGRWKITITPTYSGCPAMDMIAMQIRMTFLGAGITAMEIATQLSPAWTTDWISEAGKQQLQAYGIAPPHPVRTAALLDGAVDDRPVTCPQCGSTDTQRLSEFGSTPCKALFQCNCCKEPFDHFKCH